MLDFFFSLFPSVAGGDHVWVDGGTAVHCPPYGRKHDQQVGRRRSWKRGNVSLKSYMLYVEWLKKAEAIEKLIWGILALKL